MLHNNLLFFFAVDQKKGLPLMIGMSTEKMYSRQIKHTITSTTFLNLKDTGTEKNRTI